MNMAFLEGTVTTCGLTTLVRFILLIENFGVSDLEMIFNSKLNGF